MEEIIQKFPPRTIFHRNFCAVRQPLDDELLKIPLVSIAEKSQ